MRRKAMTVRAQSGMEAEQQQQKQPTYSEAARDVKTTMVGFDGFLLRLLDQLTGVPSSRKVIPIAGMGGIGKTTLVKNAFEHPLTVHHFDVCLWATISQQYSVENILTQLGSRLRKSISQTAGESSNRRTISEELYKSLYGRRYLVILDDMWSAEAWDAINNSFPDTNNGSRIVVTTRDLKVADHLGVSRPFEMHCLDEHSSWDLFCEKAFPAHQGCCPLELDKIGKKIVGKCKGLPLAVVVVAGHLRNSSMALEYWENVASRMDSILDCAEQCVNVLSLSYSFLPIHLKPCFLLLGAFPEDERIGMSQVIELWIAEGFIQPCIHRRLEAVGEHYIWDLYRRNLISVDGMRFNGYTRYFKLHDLVRELCLKTAKKEEFMYVFDAPQAMNKERRVVINGKVGGVNCQTKNSGAPIRCLVYERGPPSHDLKLLRTLKTEVDSSMSTSVFQQLSVQHIYMSPTSLYLPWSISLLWNLQILKIGLPDQAKVIAPYEIWDMLQLRHLDVDLISLLDPLPDDESNDGDLVLRNLHTLMNVENLRLSEEVGKRVPNIREMWLLYCDEAAMSSHYCPHNLGCFHELEFLYLQFDGHSKWRDFALSLAFPTSLKWLVLSGGCGVVWEELTMMVGSLPNLISLYLYHNSVIGSVWTPVEGKFLSLESLDIWGCHDLVHWNADSFHFPALRSLRLGYLCKLQELPSGFGEIPTLQVIGLEFCSESATISAMKILVEQEEFGNEWLRLCVTFRGDEDTLESFYRKVPPEVLTNANLNLRIQNVKRR